MKSNGFGRSIVRVILYIFGGYCCILCLPSWGADPTITIDQPTNADNWVQCVQLQQGQPRTTINFHVVTNPNCKELEWVFGDGTSKKPGNLP